MLYSYYQYGKCDYFDASVHHPLQHSFLCLSTATMVVAAKRAEADKDKPLIGLLEVFLLL